MVLGGIWVAPWLSVRVFRRRLSSQVLRLSPECGSALSMEPAQALSLPLRLPRLMRSLSQKTHKNLKHLKAYFFSLSLLKGYPINLIKWIREIPSLYL